MQPKKRLRAECRIDLIHDDRQSNSHFSEAEVDDSEDGGATASMQPIYATEPPRDDLRRKLL